MSLAMEHCLLPDEVRVSSSSSTPLSNGNGELTLSSISAFEDDFRSSIISKTESDPITAAVEKYGSDEFYGNLNSINARLKDAFFVSQVPNYPTLSSRLDAGAISPFEFAGYIKEYGISPAIANSNAASQGPKFLKSLDDFYTDSFASSVMGGFCSLMPNLFGAIGGFFDLIGKVEGLIGDALSFISKIKNIKDPIKALFDAIKVKALIEAIKEKVTKAVMGAVNKIKDAIENFDIGNVVSQVKTFVQNKVGAKLQSLKDGITKFFSEENMKMIEDKIKGIIDYGVSLFTNPSIQEIQYLIARICGFAAGIEAIVGALKDPLDSAADRFINVTNILKGRGGLATASALDAGAVRFDDATREEQINKLRGLYGARGNPPMATDDDRSQIPTWAQIKDNNHPQIRVAGSWVTKLKEDGWNEMKDTRVYVLRLQKQAKDAGIISGPLTLNSGWRSQQHNRDVDGAEDSLHLTGKAADLTWPGFDGRSDDVARFVGLARSIGFRGVIYYNTFVHLDLGVAWTGDFRTSTAAPAAQARPAAQTTPEQTPPTDEGDTGTGWSEGDVIIVQGYLQDPAYGPEYIRDRIAEDDAGTTPGLAAGLDFDTGANFDRAQRRYLASLGY